MRTTYAWPIDGETITSLELTSRSELVPAKPPLAPLTLDRVDRAAASLIRSLYVRIWAPLGSGGRSGWSAGDWELELARPGVAAWLARAGDEVVGFVELEAESNGDVGIVVLGLVPERVGQGFGGALLTRATELAWQLRPDRGSARRVWVQTSSRDHPHARPNYERRGFRVFDEQQR